MSFEKLGLGKDILSTLEKIGFVEPSPIQEQAIPVVLGGKDLIAQAYTGTGKTAAFGLPVIDQMTADKKVQVLVMTPTRELANQVSDELYRFGKDKGVRTATIYGGSSYKRQIDLVKRGAQIIVATPGRMLDLLEGNKLGEFNPSFVILDEADEMLDMGFSEDIHRIIDFLTKERQTLLFSATMSGKIKQLSKNILSDPEHISLVDANAPRTNENISEFYSVIEEKERDDAVFRILDAEEFDKVVVFCRTKREVDRLTNAMMGRGFMAKGLHGDIEQRNREKVLNDFKNNGVEVLVATDVAARGLDVEEVTHVINFHIPFDSDSYVHRIGRTGRAGKSGKAITLVTTREMRDLKKIRKDVGEQMIYAAIPSKESMIDGQVDSLGVALSGVKITKQALKFMEKYGSEMDREELLLKLVSFGLKEFNVSGPQFIGVTGDRLERFMKDLDRKGGGRDSGRGRSRRRRRRSGNGTRRRKSGGDSGGRNRNNGRRRSGGKR